jgi:hypothetical protein
VALALCVAALAMLWPRSLTFDINGRAATPGSWLETAAGQELPVRFSDGTTLLLASGTRARVAGTDRTGARVQLTQGAASLSVVHTGKARWQVQAGPFDVLVTGTRFDISWDEPSGVFSLVMHDGSVELRQPNAPSRRVIAGQVVRLSVPPLAPVPDPDLVRSTSPAVSTPSASAAPPAPSGRTLAPRTTASVAPAVAPGFRELAAEGKFHEALAEAERVGFDGLVETGKVTDLMLLGDVARYGGRIARASQAYRAVRARYGGGEEAARAAYFLGLMAFPGAASVEHFEAYLRERPGGGLAAEAMGRLLEVHHRRHNDPAARAAADRYLATFPDGPHAGLARSIAAP